jgi:hypothetical protein
LTLRYIKEIKELLIRLDGGRFDSFARNKELTCPSDLEEVATWMGVVVMQTNTVHTHQEIGRTELASESAIYLGDSCMLLPSTVNL